MHPGFFVLTTTTKTQYNSGETTKIHTVDPMHLWFRDQCELS